MKFRSDKKAVSPAISTVVLTGALVTLLLVTIVFANDFLNARIAENEFSAMKQFMQTSGLQIDDVAWSTGRTQTTRYASRYGRVNFEPIVLNYTVYVDQGNGYVFLANYSTGILLFNMHISRFNLGNDYFERLFPTEDGSFLQKNVSAPVTHTYVIEKLPMADGSFIRVVVTPSIRMLNSSITTSEYVKNYFKFYLPILSPGIHPRRSQSVTVTGEKVSVKTEGDVNAVKIQVSFPQTDAGFDENFFHFTEVVEEVSIPSGSIIEFYTGEVVVSLGLHG